MVRENACSLMGGNLSWSHHVTRWTHFLPAQAFVARHKSASGENQADMWGKVVPWPTWHQILFTPFPNASSLPVWQPAAPSVAIDPPLFLSSLVICARPCARCLSLVGTESLVSVLDFLDNVYWTEFFGWSNNAYTFIWNGCSIALLLLLFYQ